MRMYHKKSLDAAKEADSLEPTRKVGCTLDEY